MTVPHTHSFTPQPVADEGIIRDRVRYCGRQGWAIVIEYTDDPSPENHYWNRWGLPILDPDEPDLLLYEIDACREQFPDTYIRLLAYGADSTQSFIRDSILVHAPK
ncbi:MAG: ribulose bisphosphate carboxylase small subunit [Gammaproteobacteria bacterium]|nr:ribulose bisphosphate carboxylase small subunit [Gammaproteobacteria bacterium]